MKTYMDNYFLWVLLYIGIYDNTNNSNFSLYDGPTVAQLGPMAHAYVYVQIQSSYLAEGVYG